MEISKKESIEEAKVIKEPSKETRTVEVELVHEELIIERKAVQLDKASTTTTTPTTTTSSSEEIMQSKTISFNQFQTCCLSQHVSYKENCHLNILSCLLCVG